MTRKTIIWVLVILAGLFLGDQYFKNNKSDVFDITLMEVDTSMLDVVKLSFSEGDHVLHFVKDPAGWIVSSGNSSVRATPESIEKLLGNFQKIEISRIVSDNVSLWNEYGVNEKLGTRVTLFSKDKKVEDFLIGAVGQEEGPIEEINFIRLFDQKEIYELEQSNVLTINPSFDHYRNNKLFTWSSISNLNKIEFTSVKDTVLLSKSNNKWSRQDGMDMDSLKILEFLDGFSNMSGAMFVDNFDELKADELLYGNLKFIDDSNRESLNISCFRDTTREKSFILHSDSNPDTWFESDSSGLFYRIFGKLEAIVQEEKF